MEYIKKNAYLKQVMRNMRLAFDKARTGKKKKDAKEDKEPKKVTAKILVAIKYADWQKFVLDLFVGSNFDQKLNIVDDWKAVIRGKATGEIMKKSLQFGAWVLVNFGKFIGFKRFGMKEEIKTKGDKEILNTQQLFNEKELINSQKEYITRQIKVDNIEVDYLKEGKPYGLNL